jgi:hypothetical protein
MRQLVQPVNMYFIFITILTCLPFSPKDPVTVTILTVAIIAFGVLKDGFFVYSEQRHVNEMNKKFTKVYEYGNLCYQSKTWVDVKIGDIVYI